MSVERVHASISCKDLVINFCPAVIHVVELKVRKNACLACILSASKRCLRINDQRKIRTTIVKSATVKELVKHLVSISSAVIFSICTASKIKSVRNTMDHVLFSIILTVLNVNRE